MAERERVQKAVEGPVARAVELLDEARGADLETRLVMLINGWGRGLAAGLEELALAIEGIRRADSPEPLPHDASDGPRAEQGESPESAGTSGELIEEDWDEERLRARAAESRDATAALREEASSQLNPDQQMTDE